MMEQRVIPAEFPFESHYSEVKGAKIHYIDEGEGDPIVFLHGMPACNYLWRNIIPSMSKRARCIAPDLIGMGKSDKPDIAYTIFDHIDYISEFVDSLKLKNITFVLHGWGSIIGFDYAMAAKNKNKIRGVAFYESHVRPVTSWDMLSLPVQQLAAMLIDPKSAKRSIMKDNYMIEKLLQRGVLRKLSDAEMQYYSAPFQTEESRKVLWQYLQDLPLGSGPADVVELIARYSTALQKSKLPKLMFYTIPGYITTIDTVTWCRDHLQNLSLIDLGEALHFIQETNPEMFAQEFEKWYKSLP